MHVVMRYTYKILVGKPEGLDHLGDLGVDGQFMLSRFSVNSL
jgi:hypothetical protein